jgi:CxxC motif-containing protein
MEAMQPDGKERTERLTCIVCPLGCPLAVTTRPGGDLPAVAGNRCQRGLEYGRTEVSDPRRVLTTTVTLEGATLRRLPVKTAGPIPRRLVREAALALRSVTVTAPVQPGDVVLTDLLGTGVAVVATREARMLARTGGSLRLEENC